MRIIEMERKTMDGQPVYSDEGNIRDWFCVIETKEEELVYDLAHGDGSKDTQRLWNYMVINAGQGMGVCWGDDDMYGYFRPDEEVPEVDEEYTDGDNDVWVRTY